MTFGLSEETIANVRAVLSRHLAVRQAVVFGSRALGREDSRSDVDLALMGNLTAVEVERIALELDELSAPCRFDVQSYQQIRYQPLREHIDRVGRLLYSRRSEVEQLTQNS